LHHPSQRAQFERTVLPHLDAAYNLARWLLRNDADADDVTQEACVRAYRFFDSFHGGNAKTWLLTIVRHACYTWLKQHRAEKSTMPFDEQQHSSNNNDPADGNSPFSAGPEALFLQAADRRLLQRCLEALPLEFRETLVLRELEGLSYKEISAVMEVPIGTVMSRLARGRGLLQQQLTGHSLQET
jgi:RNA polymerase sigma-70 factor (ECF subfamily)